MDALEFIRERNRMCRRFDKTCDGCPAYENEWYCDSDAWDERLIDTVEQWVKEHPRKTRQSVFLEQYPETQIDNNGVLGVCPAPIFHSHRTDGGGCIDIHRKCPDCRREFWSQEVE